MRLLSPAMAGAIAALIAVALATVALAAGAVAAGAVAAGGPARSSEDLPTAGAAVAVELSSTEITVGDRIEATLTLVWTGGRPAAAPRFPAWGESWGPAEILAVGEVEASVDANGRRLYTQALTLTAFAVGVVELPAVTVVVPLTGEKIELASERGLAFEVTSVLPEDAAEIEPRAAAPPRLLPGGSGFLRTTATLTALCLLMALALRHRLDAGGGGSATRPGDLAAPLSPLAQLLRRLHQLDPAASEPAHTGLSLALREFLSRSLGFPALFRTTRQIQRRLLDTPVPAVVSRRTVDLLRDCDQVKYARLSVETAQTGERLERTRILASEIDAGLGERPHRPAAEETTP